MQKLAVARAILPKALHSKRVTFRSQTWTRVIRISRIQTSSGFRLWLDTLSPCIQIDSSKSNTSPCIKIMSIMYHKVNPSYKLLNLMNSNANMLTNRTKILAFFEVKVVKKFTQGINRWDRCLEEDNRAHNNHNTLHAITHWVGNRGYLLQYHVWNLEHWCHTPSTWIIIPSRKI